MKSTFFFALLLMIISTNSYAIEKYTLSSQEGAYLTYVKSSKIFSNETTKYNYIYKIHVDKSNNTCRIAAVPAEYSSTFPELFFDGVMLQRSDDLLVLSKNQTQNDPYQEVYFIYPKLGIGFMVIGKSSDGFSGEKSAFPSASLAAIPLSIK